MKELIYFNVLISLITISCFIYLYKKIKPGFVVINSFFVKTKNALPILSITISFKGIPVSYINPMVYIKSKSGLYKATLFSGTFILENTKKESIKLEIPDVIKNEKILPFSLGVFNINIFYPTQYEPGNKTYLYVTYKNGKLKKFKLPLKIR